MLKKNLKLAYKINRLVVFDFPPFSGGTKGGGDGCKSLSLDTLVLVTLVI